MIHHFVKSEKAESQEGSQGLGEEVGVIPVVKLTYLSCSVIPVHFSNLRFHSFDTS